MSRAAGVFVENPEPRRLGEVRRASGLQLQPYLFPLGP